MNFSILKEVNRIVYHTSNNNNNNEDDYYQTCLYDVGCLNEIRISNIIKTELFSEEEFARVPFYFVVDHKFIMLKDSNLNIINIPIKYVLLEYNLNISKYQPLNEYLSTVEYPSQFLSTMLDIYSNVLNSLLVLEKSNICFFRLSADNILIDHDSNTVLSDFKNSLFLEEENGDNNYTDFIQLLESTTCYTYKPIEIHLVHYLLKINGSPLSYSSIDEVSTYFAEKMEFLKHFDKEYKTKYYQECVRYLKSKYLNKPKDHILKEIIRETRKTWDNFALSILFLHIFENMISVFSLNNTIINELVVILKQNLDPIPNQRHSLTYTMDAVGKLLLKTPQDWSFLRLIPKSKMKKLYERIVN